MSAILDKWCPAIHAADGTKWQQAEIFATYIDLLHRFTTISNVKING